VGSTFWFELPSAWRASAADNRARVLVIEDDPGLTALLSECLALDGLEVELAGTGEAGLERAFARQPAVVCLDIYLPGALDGWQVLVQLKANPLTANVPVIVCTGEQGRSTAATLGATEFLAKPYTGDQLREVVARQLSAERSSVLVVDDDIALRRLVIETLARDGGELREAADGLEALAMIAVRDPPSPGRRAHRARPDGRRAPAAPGAQRRSAREAQVLGRSAALARAAGTRPGGRAARRSSPRRVALEDRHMEDRHPGVRAGTPGVQTPPGRAGPRVSVASRP
jgi:CheY-like chemotaxis protein